jgi:hypothetical protein
MHGSYTLTLPLGKTNLYTAILAVAIVPSNPTPSFILPKSVQELEIQADGGNLANTIQVYDAQGNPGRILYAGDDYVKRSNRNSIDLTTFSLSPSVAGLVCEVEIESV